MFFINSVSILGYVAHEGKETCSLIVMSCSICSIWSYGGAVVSRPGTRMSFGSAAGSHRGAFGSIGLSSGAISKDGGPGNATRRVDASRLAYTRESNGEIINADLLTLMHPFGV